MEGARLVVTPAVRASAAPLLARFAFFFSAFFGVCAGMFGGAFWGEMDASAADAFAPGELIVQAADGRSLGEEPPPGVPLLAVEAIIPPRPDGSPLRKRLERVWRLRFSSDADMRRAQAYYERKTWVLWTERNRIARPLQSETVPNDPEWANLWNLVDIQMPKAWSVERGNANVVVAVIDSGADLTHPDLQGQFWENPGEIPGNGLDDDRNGYADDILGWDFTHAPTLYAEGDHEDPDPTPQDETGHGTHVAGIILAAPNNGTHTAGIAWNCKLMPLRSGYTGGDGVGLLSSDSAEAIVYAADNGADIINMSWGSEGSSRLLQDAARYAQSQGAFMCAAAGNSFDDGIRYPAALPETFSAAASDINGAAADFTSGNAQADLAAPGSRILSLHLEGGLRSLNGTSMSAAHISGAAALMKAKRPSLSAMETGDLLKAAGDPLSEEGALLGVRKLNVYAALLASEGLYARFDPGIPRGAAESLLISAEAGGPRYAGMRLLYGATRTPARFELIAEAEAPAARIQLRWPLGGLPEGEYMLRLEASDASNGAAVDHLLIRVDRTAPRLLTFFPRDPLFAPVLAGGQRRLLAWAALDDESRIRLELESGEVFQNGTPLRSLLALLETDGPVGYVFRAENLAGLTLERSGVVDAKPVAPNPANRSSLTARRLPSLNVARRSADFNGNGVLEIAGVNPAALQDAQLYELNAVLGLRSVHRFPPGFAPLDIGDADGDLRMETLGVEDRALVAFEAASEGGYPTARRPIAENVYGARYIDLDGDGKEEIAALQGSSTLLAVSPPSDNRFEPTASLRNPTDGGNWVADGMIVLDAPGAPVLTLGDSDGELFSLRFRGGEWTFIGSQQLPFTRIWAVSEAGPDRAAVIGETGGETGGARRGEGGSAPALALYRWESGAFQLDERFGVLWFSGSEADARLSASPSDSGGSGGVALSAGGWLYWIEEGELVWAERARRGGTPALYPQMGALAFDGLDGLRIVLSEPDRARLSVPFQLEAEPVDESSAQLRWFQQEADQPADIYRAADGGSSQRIASGVVGGTYLDRGAPSGVVLIYQAAIGFFRSNRAAVALYDRPNLLSAEALSPRRVRLHFSEPMTAEGRYLVRREGGADALEPSSILASVGSRRLILTFRTPLLPGPYSAEALHPRLCWSEDGMPLNPDRAAVPFRFAPSETFLPGDLSEARVYPNPVSLSRAPARAQFDRLPPDTEIRLHSADGALAAVGYAGGASEWTWRLLNDRREPVPPGVYLFELRRGGERRFGKIAVVR